MIRRRPAGQPPSFSILRATTAHRDLAREAVAEVHERAPVDEAALEDFLRDERRFLLLAIEEERVVGSLNGHALRHPHRPEPQFLLYGIDVREESRRRGVGRALVERFVEEARAARASEVWVLTGESNRAAMALYRRCGMRRENPDDVMFTLPIEAGEPAEEPGL